MENENARARARIYDDEADKGLVRASSANETRPEDRGKNWLKKEKERERGVIPALRQRLLRFRDKTRAATFFARARLVFSARIPPFATKPEMEGLVGGKEEEGGERGKRKKIQVKKAGACQERKRDRERGLLFQFDARIQSRDENTQIFGFPAAPPPPPEAGVTLDDYRASRSDHRSFSLSLSLSLSRRLHGAAMDITSAETGQPPPLHKSHPHPSRVIVTRIIRPVARVMACLRARRSAA